MPNEIKQLESLGEFRNAIKLGNLHPVLAGYEKDIFTRLGFFNEKLFKEWPRFLFPFCLFVLLH